VTDNVDQRVDLRGDGRIILYKREGLKNPKWQVRVRVPNATSYKIVSSKTSDQKQAERFAMDLYEDLYMHVKAGGSVKSKTFRQVFEEWEKATIALGPNRQGGTWTGTIERIRSYSLEFFGPQRIDQIKPSDFADYFVWRKSNYVRRVPTNGTLKRERTCLVPVFKFAVTKGYIQSVPEFEAPKSKAERRPTFTIEEWRKLTRQMREWVKDGKQKATWRDRYVAQQYFLILANTGLRVGELRTLRWSDLRTVSTQDGTRLVGYVRGKTGEREVVFQQGSEEYVKRLYDLRLEEVSDPKWGHGKVDRDGLVICHPDGSSIGTMKRSFQSLLDFAGISIFRNGGKRTIYSLRHFYATQRLSHETSPFLLAKQMGTSVEMLEKFYGQTVTSSLAMQVSRSGQRRTTSDGDYPFE
jgi:integrase